MAKPALGRGLGALLGGSPVPGGPTLDAYPYASGTTTASAPAPAPESRGQVQRVPLQRVRPCAFQPRREFSDEALRELADSIREKGIVQPLLVREQGGHFELIAGERRWRAAQILGLADVPVIVREADDRDVLELALIENLQRENLNALEEAQGYARLVNQFQLTQEEVALKVGKSRAVVANSLRLLKLAPTLQHYLRDGRLSVGHAKVILGLPTDDQQQLAAERAIKDGLNVRQTEGLVSKLLAHAVQEKSGSKRQPIQDAHVASLEDRLRQRLGTKVRLRYTQGKGALEISFFSDQDLERVLQVLGVNPD